MTHGLEGSEEPPPPFKISWSGNWFKRIFCHIKSWQAWAIENSKPVKRPLGDMFIDPTTGGGDESSGLNNGNVTDISYFSLTDIAAFASEPRNYIGFTKELGLPSSVVPTTASFISSSYDFSQITISPAETPFPTGTLTPTFEGDGIRIITVKSYIQIGIGGPVLASDQPPGETAENLERLFRLCDLSFSGKATYDPLTGSYIILLP